MADGKTLAVVTPAAGGLQVINLLCSRLGCIVQAGRPHHKWQASHLPYERAQEQPSWGLSG